MEGIVRTEMRFLDGVKMLPADWASIIPQLIIP